MTRNLFLSQETSSCHKKSILVRRIHFLWLSLLYKLVALRESYQKFLGILVHRLPVNIMPWHNVALQ